MRILKGGEEKPTRKRLGTRSSFLAVSGTGITLSMGMEPPDKVRVKQL